MDRVALRAWGMCTPFGDHAQTLAALAAGQIAQGSLAAWGMPDERGAPLPQDAEPEDDPGLRILGRHGRMLEPVLQDVHAVGGAGDVARERLGMYLAMGMVDAQPHDLIAAVRAARGPDGAFDLAKFFAGTFRLIHPLWPLSMLNNVAAGHFAIDLDIRGDNLVVASGADGGIRAVIEAAAATRSGLIDAALVAGASEAVGAFAVARHQHEYRDPIHGLGEAGAAWLLACAPTETPHAWILGGATTFGAHPDRDGPTADAWRRAIQRACADLDAGATIDVIVSDPRDATLAEVCAAWPDATRQSAKPALGILGPASALVEGALAVAQAPAGHRILVLEGTAAGSAGALVLETA